MPGIAPRGSVRASDLSVGIEDVRQVEKSAAKAWPATENRPLEGWQLRYSPGVSNRRANSVLPITSSSDGAVLERIEEVEKYYNRRGLPARFMISPAACPDNLDPLLDSLGYAIDAPTLVQWGELGKTIDCCGNGPSVEVLAHPTNEWMAVYMEGVEDTQDIALKADLIGRIEGPRGLALLREDGKPAAVGLSVVDQGWAGVFCMHTLNSHRRRGLARQVLGGLLNWARTQGADKTYLQVECDNLPAQKFYQSAGFSTEYGYHYRTKETACVSP